MNKRVIISRRTGRPVVCFNCGHNHRVFYDDPDPGCDWDAIAGFDRALTDSWHPADDPRHLTSDRIGFSVSC